MKQVCEMIEVTAPTKPLQDIEKSLITTYKKDIFRPFVKTINEFNLIEPNDKIAIGISGGKDSLIMAKLFQELKRHNKIPFEVVFIAMDPGFNEVNRKLLETNCKYLNIPLEVRESEIFHVVEKIAKENPCYMCARMRRGFLYDAAKSLGCNKLALGHHFDDVIETTMLNMFYGGSFKTMVPKIQAMNFDDIELIRPMMKVKERDIIRWLQNSGIQSMNCGCTVAAEKTSSKRREIKELIKKLREVNPDVDKSIYRAATNVNLEQVLGYTYQNKKVHFNDIYEERSKKS